MKKLLTMLTLLTMLLLSACTFGKNETIPAEKPQEEQPKPEENSTPNNTPNNTPNTNPKHHPGNDYKPSLSYEEYANKMSGYLFDLSDLMYDFSDLNMAVSQNPDVIYTDEWINAASNNLDEMDRVISEINALNPPPEAQKLHDTIIKAMDEYQFVVDNYPTAIANLDIDLLNSCTAALSRGNEYLNQALNLIPDGLTN